MFNIYFFNIPKLFFIFFSSTEELTFDSHTYTDIKICRNKTIKNETGSLEIAKI